MGVHLDIIGKKQEGDSFVYNSDDVMLYALGIGATVQDEFDFVYEKNLKVFPTFGMIPCMPLIFGILIPQANLRLDSVLHGEHKMILHKPIPISGTILTTITCDAMYDKGNKGAVCHVTLESRDEQGNLLFENKPVIIDRSAGNFGGDRGPKAESFDPPDGKDPAFRVAYDTSPNQAALYRLTGDKNPLHIDPVFARKAGFDQPILHGLCTFGYAGRAILHGVCGGDPGRFKSFSVRFMNVVYPGETIITEGWKMKHGAYIVRVTTPEGKLVFGNAVAEVVEPE